MDLFIFSDYVYKHQDDQFFIPLSVRLHYHNLCFMSLFERFLSQIWLAININKGML
jgi:hypothetical protein